MNMMAAYKAYVKTLWLATSPSRVHLFWEDADLIFALLLSVHSPAYLLKEPWA